MPDLTELRRLLNEVTRPQPWTTDNGYDWEACIVAADDEVVAGADHDAADLIAAAVNALPALLDAAEALERVKALHYTHECVPLDFHCFIVFGGGCAAVGTCATCRVSYPCPTLRAIDGEPKP